MRALAQGMGALGPVPTPPLLSKLGRLPAMGSRLESPPHRRREADDLVVGTGLRRNGWGNSPTGPHQATKPSAASPGKGAGKNPPARTPGSETSGPHAL